MGPNSGYQLIPLELKNIEQIIEDESLKYRKEIKKLSSTIKKIDGNVNSLGDAQLRGFQEIDSILTRNSQEINDTLVLNRGMFNYRLEDVKKIIVDEVRNRCNKKKPEEKLK